MDHDAVIRAQDRFLDQRGGQPWLETYVTPYYLKWMGAAATRAEARELLPEVRQRATELRIEDIAAMLALPWRIQLMGIWYAVARTDGPLTKPLHHAFDACYGTLTAPALIAAVLTYPDESTSEVLHTYRDRAVTNRFGGIELVDTALQRLDRHGVRHPQTPADGVLGDLLDVARLLSANP